jgi:hypothetical protein
MKSSIYKFQIIAVLATLFCSFGEALAQAPPPPPPSGAPLDGGIVAFLLIALFGGSKFISKKQ